MNLRQSSTRPKRQACPYCYSVCEDPLFVDVGIGEIQCEPRVCRTCGAYEVGPYDKRKKTIEERIIGWYAPSSFKFESKETPYRVWCKKCGPQFLSKTEYQRQMNNVNSRWKCPVCYCPSVWDDSWFEESELNNE